MLELGEEYENRRGIHVVLSLRGNALRIRYQDGSEETLNAVFQERIISNINRGNSSSHPRNVAGNWLQPGGQLYLSHQEIARA